MLKLAIFAGLLYVLLKRWLDQPLALSYLSQVFASKEGVFYFISCIALILPNWLIEAHIWRKLIEKIHFHTLFQSLQSVLSGLTLGILTPFMTGDYVGRVMKLPAGKKKAGIGANLAGSYIFTLLSIHLGALGLGYFLYYVQKESNQLYFVLFYAMCIASVLGVVLVLSKAPVWLARIKFLTPYLAAFLSYSPSKLLEIYLLAFFRYCVFLFQFVLMFWAFDVSVPFVPLVGGILVIFLAKTIGSGINIFGDLTSRELVGIAYFNLFGADPGAVAWVIFLLWLVNIIIPAFAGLFFISKIKKLNLRGD